MLGWLFKKARKRRPRTWAVIYSEDGFASSLGNPDNIPRWLRKRVLALKWIPGDRYHVFKGRRYEYRVSFAANHGHGRVVVRAPRKW